ncbi:deoxyguanosine kinase [Niallia nealsonii AAU1]|nr:deoxyguanosine kinase [Niallia nealsonii AAU1]
MNDFKKNNPQIPVLDFNGDTLDFVQNKQDLVKIINTIKETLNIGAFNHESTNKI